ncbi:MAG: hypothetical protein OEY28_12805, partial [Nitrospira sp.]|nr:hypothetical protein [Nitrospira sp.]
MAVSQTVTEFVTQSPVGRRGFKRILAGSLGFSLVGALLGAAALSDRPELGAAVGAGGMFLAVSTLVALVDWRVGLGLLVVIVLSEDSLRKALPGAPGWVSLGKDFVVVACYLSFLFAPALAHYRRELSNRVFLLFIAPIALWALFVVLQAFNPGVPHWLVGVSGIRTWFLYVPMAFLIASIMRDEASVLRLFRWVAVVSIPLLAVALAQNWFGSQLPSFLREGVFKRERSLAGGGWIGYNESLFASPTLYSLVCVFLLCVTTGLLRAGHFTRRWTILLWIAGYSAVAGAYISGVRTGVLFVLCAIAAISPMLLWRVYRAPDGNHYRRRGLVAGGIAGLLIGALLLSAMGELRMRALVTSFDPGIVEDRLEKAIDEARYSHGGDFGHGTGTAGASGRVMSLLGEPSPSNEWVEWGTAVITYSFGDAGVYLGVFVGLWLFLGMLSFAAERRMGRLFPLRYALWVYLCAQMSWYLFKAFPVLENGTMSLIFWSSAGAIIGINRLE